MQLLESNFRRCIDTPSDDSRRHFAKALFSTLLLLIAANGIWAFIFVNYDRLADIRHERSQNVDTGLQNAFIHDMQKQGYLHVDDPEQYATFVPSKITIPSLRKTAPVFFSTSPEDSNTLLNSGAVAFGPNQDNYGIRTSIFIFGHSSAEEKGPYSYLFTNLPRMGSGGLVFLDDGATKKVYKYASHMIIDPEKLDGLPKDEEGKLYLVTCYPFLSSKLRYVAEFELQETLRVSEEEVGVGEGNSL